MPINQGLYDVNPGSGGSGWTKPRNIGGAGVSNEYKPPKTSGPDDKGEVGDPLRGVGSVEPNLTDIPGSAEQAKQETQDVAEGMRRFLFGSPAMSAGTHGGILGDIPVLGDIGRFGTEVVSNTFGGIGDLIGGTAAGIGGGLEHVSLGADEKLIALFKSIPDSFEGKQEALKQIEADGNNTGAFTAAGHYMSRAIKAYKDEVGQRELAPSLHDNLFVENASMADAVTNLFGTLGFAQRYAERAWAGMGTPGQGGRNRLQTIMDVGDGEIAFNVDEGILGTGLLAGGNAEDGSGGLNPVEQHVYNMVKANLWTDDQALDFLASHNAGISHAASAQIAGVVATDPLNVAGLGASAVASLGRTGIKLLQMERLAISNLNAARAAGASADDVARMANAVKEVQGGIRSGDRVRAANVLAQIAARPFVGDSVRTFGSFYETMGATYVGKVAKATRIIIDPLHMWGNSPRVAKAIDEGSNVISQSYAKVHGAGNYGHLGIRLGSLPGVGDATLEKFHRGVAIYSQNVFHRLASRRYQAVQAWRGVLRDLRDDSTAKGVQQALRNSTKDTVTRVEEEIGSFIKYDWTTGDLDDLAIRSEKMLGGGMDRKEWAEFIRGLNAEERSMIHSSTYALAVSDLHSAVAAFKRLAPDLALPFGGGIEPEDLVLLARTTLTDLGKKGIMDRVEAAGGNLDAIMEEIANAKRQYPEMRSFVNDPSSKQKTADAFKAYLESISHRLPHQIENTERTALKADPQFQSISDFDAKITWEGADGKPEGIFTLGFRPKKEFRWGVEEDLTGGMHVVGDPWYDQVSDVMESQIWRGVRRTSYNTAGMPLGGAVKVASRTLDASEQAARTLFRGVTGTMVTQAAHKKFVARMMPRLRAAGLTETQAEEVWNALRKAVDARADVSGMRGLGQHDMWEAVRQVTRKWPSSAGMTPREVMLDVLYAFEGDLRTVGLTQKFSGRVKRVVGQYTNRNMAGVVSEHIWPMLKFRYNPIFQVQEKVEPWVLTGGRGGRVALGNTPTELDRMTAALYKRYVDSNLVAMSDQDIAELSAKFGIGSELEVLSMGREGAIANIKKNLNVAAILDVQGVKRLNMLRTFQKGLAKELRGSWDSHMPGEFDRMIAAERVRVGYFMDEDEIATRWINSNLTANDITVQVHRDANGAVIGWQTHIENSIREGWDAAPQHIGEMRNLEISGVVRRIGIETDDGMLLGSEQDLRRALGSNKITLERVERELRDLGAHPEYIQRFRSALRFNWNTFWSDVKTAFNASDEEIANLQSYYARGAEARGMTPTDYMSQVYSPNIANDGVGGVGSLGHVVELMRNGRPHNDPGLAVLVAGQGADARKLYQQMAAITIQHLDPSAKAALIRSLVGSPGDEGPLFGMLDSALLDSIDSIENMAVNGVTVEAFGDRLMRYFQGAPPTGARTAVPLDELPRLGYIREHAAQRLVSAGRQRVNGRWATETSDDLRARGAAHYEALDPHREVRVRSAEGQMVSIDDVGLYSRVERVKLRAEAQHLPEEEYKAYEAVVADARRLYREIEDELGIKIGIGPEYQSADAMRADLSRVKRNGQRNARYRRPATGNYHPIIEDRDMFMIRTVMDVFGHGQEATELGADAAIFRGLEQFSDEAKGVLLGDVWGRQSELLYSSKTVPDLTQPVRTFDAYEMKRGRAMDEVSVTAGRVPGKMNTRDIATRKIGNGLRVLDAEGEAEIVEMFDTVEDMFPGVRFGGWDIHRPLAQGASQPIAATFFRYGNWSLPSIVFDMENSGWFPTAAARRAHDAKKAAEATDTFTQPYAMFPVDRPNYLGQVHPSGEPAHWTPGNVRPFASNTRMGTAIHEMGHAIDNELRRRALEAGLGTGMGQDFLYADVRFQRFMEDTLKSEVRGRVSGYAQVDMATNIEFKSGDYMAEMTSMAFDPALEFETYLKALRTAKRKGAARSSFHDFDTDHIIEGPEMPGWNAFSPNSPFVTPNGVLDEELILHINEYRNHMKRMNVWDPKWQEKRIQGPPSPHAGRNMGEVQRTTPGAVKWEPEYRVGRMPQDFVDEVFQNYLGTGRYAESNPDIARMAHYAQEQMTIATESFFGGVGRGALTADGAAEEVFLKQPGDFSWDDIFGSKSGLPAVKGVPFDYSQGLLWDAAVQSMAAKWQDAFRLQYFAQNRSMFQRTLNHPMFGIYPASYMWGKVGPELIRFMALQPFGINTGVGARMLGDIQMSVGAQRTWDAEFDAKIEELGHSASLDFLSYLLPATPWSVPASYPAYLRSFAQQGLEQQAAIEAGGVADEIDWIEPVTKTLKRTAPWTTYVPWMGRVANELTGRPKEGTPEYDVWLAEQYAKMPVPEEPGAEAAPEGQQAAPELDRAVSGSELQPVLENSMEDLMKALR